MLSLSTGRGPRRVAQANHFTCKLVQACGSPLAAGNSSVDAVIPELKQLPSFGKVLEKDRSCAELAGSLGIAAFQLA